MMRRGHPVKTREKSVPGGQNLQHNDTKWELSFRHLGGRRGPSVAGAQR